MNKDTTRTQDSFVNYLREYQSKSRGGPDTYERHGDVYSISHGLTYPRLNTVIAIII